MKYAITLDTKILDEEKKIKAIIQLDETKEELKEFLNSLYPHSTFVKHMQEDAQMHKMDADKVIAHAMYLVRQELEMILSQSYLD